MVSMSQDSYTTSQNVVVYRVYKRALVTFSKVRTSVMRETGLRDASLASINRMAGTSPHLPNNVVRNDGSSI